MKYNTTKISKKEKSKTINLAGGKAYNLDDKLKLITFAFTNFMEDTFYRSSNTCETELKNLVDSNDPEFVAKVALFARKNMGMRSVSHVMTSLLAYKNPGFFGFRKFISSVCKIPSDASEILSHYCSIKDEKRNNGRYRIPSCLKKGIRLAFNHWNDYQIAKYKMTDKKWSMIDMVNMIGPIPTEQNEKSLKSLVSGDLKQFNTWNSELSEAGLEENKEEAKADVWRRMITQKLIPQKALVMNMRNIAKQCPDIVDAACELMNDEERIKTSLLFPFRYYIMMKMIENTYDDIPEKLKRKIIQKTDMALEKSLINIPSFDGSTLVAIDVSGSMHSQVGTSSILISECASLFASMLFKKCNADVIAFSDDARYAKYLKLNDSITSCSEKIMTTMRCGGTNFSSIFKTANSKYDRIFILSDMQSWCGKTESSFNLYKSSFGVNPKLYCFDLSGYGTSQFYGNNVYTFAGFNDKIFDVVKMFEQDPNVLIKTIEDGDFNDF